MLNFRRKLTLILAPKVLVIDFRPAAIPGNWNKTDDLIEGYIAAIRTASLNKITYTVVQKLEVPEYPVLQDGRQYDDASWTQAMADDKSALRDAHGNYCMADYGKIMQDHNLIAQVKNKTINEVWMFGGPYFGFFESRMVGKGAFWCNAPAIEQNCPRFVMMGYNYQRDVREMVHDFGHRAESILAMQFGSQSFLGRMYAPPFPSTAAALGVTPKNDYEQWLLEHGTVHRKPGGADYSQDEVAWVTDLKSAWFAPVVDPNRVKTS